MDKEKDDKVEKKGQSYYPTWKGFRLTWEGNELVAPSNENENEKESDNERDTD